MAKKQREATKTDGWKDTYGDMVTLLLCFFVLLYSMSSVDSEKWQAFVKAFTNPGEDTAQVVLIPSDELGDHMVPAEDHTDTGNPDPAENVIEDFDDLFEKLKEFTEEQGMQDTVQIESGEGVVYVRYQNSLFFQPDSAQLLPTAMPSLEFLGESLKQLEDQLWLVSISGHTASVAYENYAVSDWDLSAMRASAVAKYFEDESGLNPKLLRALGFGKSYPIDTNDTPEGRAHNRRVELVIISNKSPIAQSEAMASAVSGLFDAKLFEEKENMHGLEDVLDPDTFLDGLLSDDSGAGEPADSGVSGAGEPADSGASGTGEPADSGAASVPEPDSTGQSS